ncbi:hypothetical protein [Paucibacter soli]|uniref:hypothetical protein n=1 Tax=Paucibacter soli TaxID=3133433 RepID=UPI0030B0B88E
MLRALLVLLLAANLAFYAWTQGWLDGVTGLRAQGDREPERLQQQQHPERLSLVSPQNAKALLQQARACLELGPVEGSEALRGLQAQLDKAGVAPAEWQDIASEVAGVWAVATIKFPNKEFQARKEETYKRLKISYEYLSGPADEMPSMVLSRHASEKAAADQVEALAQRALKGLRVLPLQAPKTLHLLRFAQADGGLQARLAALKNGGNLRSCAPEVAAAAAAAAASAAAAQAPASAASR